MLRIARFQARFPDFSIAPETLLLLRRMVADGETRALVPERIGMEFKKGLMTKAPEKMFETLKTIGFWEDFVPDLPCTDETLALLRKTARENLAYPERFAALTLEAQDEETIARFMKSVRADRESADLAQAFLCARQLLTTALDTEALCRFYRRADAGRRPERVGSAAHLWALSADRKEERILQGLSAWNGVDAGAVARNCPDKRGIPEAVLAARRAAVKQCFT